MSWGDQVLDELEMNANIKYKRKSKANRDEMLLTLFGLWLKESNKINLSEEELQEEIKKFLKRQ